MITFGKKEEAVRENHRKIDYADDANENNSRLPRYNMYTLHSEPVTDAINNCRTDIERVIKTKTDFRQILSEIRVRNCFAHF